MIFKKMPRRHSAFRSRFRDGGSDFPLRQYLRCREEIFTGCIHAVLLVAFAVTLAFFGRTVWNLFEVHGAHLSPWFRRGAILLIALAILVVLRRAVTKVAGVREARQQMQEYRNQLPGRRQQD